MIKQISFLSLVVFGLLFSASALAQGTVRVSMSDADRKAFCAGASAVAPVAGQTTVSSCCAKLNRQISRLWTANGLRKKDIAALNARISELEANGVTPADIQAAIAPLQEQLDAMTAERDQAIAELKVSLNGRMDKLQAQLDAQAKADHGLSQRIDDLQRQVNEIAGRGEPIVAGVRANAFLLTAFDDGPDYAGLQLAVRLDLRLSPKYYVYLQPGVLLTLGNQPTGASADVGVGYRLFEDGEYKGSLEVGPALSALHLNSQLDAQQINAALSAGVAFRFPHGIRLGGAVLGGAQFSSDAPRGVIGGVVGGGLDF